MWPFKDSPRPELIVEPAIPSQETVQVSDPPPATTSHTTLDQTSDAQRPRSSERLSLPFVVRAPIMMGAAFMPGFIIGATKGATAGGDLFRAENAHRLPTDKSGWYQYHKTKNYRSMMSGLKGGARYGAVCVGWWSVFMVTEEAIDRSRIRLFEDRDDSHVSTQRDVASTVMAAMAASGMYSWTNGLDHFSTAKVARTALRFSLAYGVVQDLIATFRGRPPAYIAWLRS